MDDEQASESSSMIEHGKMPKYQSEERLENAKYLLGVAYMLAMGVCGTVLVALGSTLEELARNCNTGATAVGTVFIARGIGAVLGAILSAKLYLWFQGKTIMGSALILITAILIALSLNKSVLLLHIYFLLLGVGTAVTDTGCQIMTRKIHGSNAGPWLGANTVVFGIAGALVPLIELATGNVIIQYVTLAGMVFVVCALIVLGPNPEQQIQDTRTGTGTVDAQIQDAPSAAASQSTRAPKPKLNTVPHYHVEIAIALMVFFFIGGKVTTTAYLASYVEQTSALAKHQGSMLILVLWLSITVGRVAGVQDQRYLTNETLSNHLSVFCLGGMLGMALVLLFPADGNSLWIGVACYGLCNGPCVGYCYDLNNRITYPSETSMSIVMFGLNFGASLVPYATALAWSEEGGARTLIISTLLSMLLPLPLLFIARRLSYVTTTSTTTRKTYITGNTQDATATCKA